jgi:hypothetical protein
VIILQHSKLFNYSYPGDYRYPGDDRIILEVFAPSIEKAKEMLRKKWNVERLPNGFKIWEPKINLQGYHERGFPKCMK